MWQGFAISLREGIESFLLVALLVAYLRRSGRHGLVRAAALGTAVAVLLSALFGWALRRASTQPLWEALLAIVTTALVGSLLVWMARAGKHLRARLERAVDRVARSGARGFVGVAALTTLLVAREGMEIALLVIGAIEQVPAPDLLVGLALGTAAAVAIGATWLALGRRVRIGALLGVLTAFLAIFVVELALYAVHELSEAGIVPNAQAIHDATESLGPQGPIGHALSYILAAVPTVWLAWAWARARSGAAGASHDAHA